MKYLCEDRLSSSRCVEPIDYGMPECCNLMRIYLSVCPSAK